MIAHTIPYSLPDGSKKIDIWLSITRKNEIIRVIAYKFACYVCKQAQHEFIKLWDLNYKHYIFRCLICYNKIYNSAMYHYCQLYMILLTKCDIDSANYIMNLLLTPQKIKIHITHNVIFFNIPSLI